MVCKCICICQQKFEIWYDFEDVVFWGKVYVKYVEVWVNKIKVVRVKYLIFCVLEVE